VTNVVQLLFFAVRKCGRDLATGVKSECFSVETKADFPH